MAQFTRIKIWNSGDILYASDLNNEFNNLLNGFTPTKIDSVGTTVAAMQQVLNPGAIGSETIPTNLNQELLELRYVLQAIKGSSATQWYAPITANLTDIYNAIQDPVVKTDGTDPGQGGVSSNSFLIAPSTMVISTSAATATQTLCTTTLTSRANYPVALYAVGNPGTFLNRNSFYTVITFSGVPAGPYTVLVSIKLSMGATQILQADYPITFTVPKSSTFSITGASSASLSNGVVPSVSGGTYSISGTETNNSGTYGFGTSIPLSAVNLWEIPTTAQSGTVYTLSATITNPTFTTGTIQTDFSCQGRLVAREIK